MRRLLRVSQPEPIVYLVDRCLGTGAVPDALRAALEPHEHLEVLDDLFPQDAQDDAWIPAIGARGWIILTKDKAIQRRPNEVQAFLAAQTAVFVFSRGGVSGERMGLAWVVALPAIRKALRRFKVPMLGRVTLAGEVAMAWAEGEKLDPPKVIKVRSTGHKGGG